MEFSAAEWSAIHNSLRVGLFVVLVSLPPGICLGYLLARHRFPGKWLVEVAVNLALVVPPVVSCPRPWCSSAGRRRSISLNRST